MPIPQLLSCPPSSFPRFCPVSSCSPLSPTFVTHSLWHSYFLAPSLIHCHPLHPLCGPPSLSSVTHLSTLSSSCSHRHLFCLIHLFFHPTFLLCLSSSPLLPLPCFLCHPCPLSPMISAPHSIPLLLILSYPPCHSLSFSVTHSFILSPTLFFSLSLYPGSSQEVQTIQHIKTGISV